MRCRQAQRSSPLVQRQSDMDAVSSRRRPEGSELDPAYWCECHFPAPIADYLATFASNLRRPEHRTMLRARRFRAFWVKHPDEDDALARHWKALKQAALSEDALINLFLVMPDAAMRNPFPAATGIRSNGPREMSVREERESYAVNAKHAEALRRFLFSDSCRRLRYLLSDAVATGGEALDHATKFQATNGQLRAALVHLERLLSLADPAAKYPYGQPDGPDAASQAYVAVVASLNRYLSKPKHAALAYVAQVNNPGASLTSAALGKAWSRSADKNSEK